jgi:hypothetical protein
VQKGSGAACIGIQSEGAGIGIRKIYLEPLAD